MMDDWVYVEEKIPFTKNKYFNLQIGREARLTTLFDLMTGITFRSDHCGFKFHLTILWLYFIFYTYDSRHWCEKCNKFSDETCYEENHDES